MKKAIIGVVAVGSIITMAAKCKRMMSGQCRAGEAGGMREHCKEMMAAHKAHREIAETPNEGEQEAPQFVGSGEAVGV